MFSLLSFRPLARRLGRLLGVVMLGLSMAGAASDRAILDNLLRRPVIDPEVTLREVQTFTESRVPVMPAVKSASEWAATADRLRRDVLDRVVFRGEAAKWRKLKTRVEWLGTIPGGSGYRVRKLRYEAVPGLWIPAVLYEPENLSGPVPVVLNVNGHEGIGKSVSYKQARCINQVKRGMIALNPEWIGMGQLNGTNYLHYRMNQLDLCGTSGLAPFHLAMTRGLDILLAHPHADPQRVAVAGLSGGGWQTIFVSALDPRVTLCNPVAGYSSFRTRARHLSDLGDSEQTPSDLATVADYTHLTAMLAPRPALLTFNQADNCCFAAPHAMPPLLEAAAPIYALFGRPGRLRIHVSHHPGDHNFGPDNRQALYRMLGDFFEPKNRAYVAAELPFESEVLAHTNLLVDLPAPNADFNSLARQLMAALPTPPKLPVRLPAALRWQEDEREKLRRVVRFAADSATATRVAELTTNGLHAVWWRLHVGTNWTVPVVELARAGAKDAVVLFAEAGRASLAGEAQRWLEAGRRVVAFDPFYFGEARVRSHDFLFALLIAAVGERPLGVQAGQAVAVVRWLRERDRSAQVTLASVGPRAGTIALVAGALAPEEVQALELVQPLGSLREVIEFNVAVNEVPEWFCFGLLAATDLPRIGALMAPRPLTVRQPSARARSEFGGLDGWYRTWGVEHTVVP